MDDSKTLHRPSYDLGNLQSDYHKAEVGDGVYMRLENNKTREKFRSLDFCGGAAVSCLGNGGENASAEYVRVVEAAAAQMQKLAYVSHTTYRSDVNFDLSELLVRNANRYLVSDEDTKQRRYKEIETSEASKISHAIIVNSGSEAAETAIKAVWQYWRQQGKPYKSRILSRESSYHGNTLGALALGEFPSRQDTYKGLIKPRTPLTLGSESLSGHNSRCNLGPGTNANEMHDEPLEIQYIKFDRYYPFGDKPENESEDEYVYRLVNNLQRLIKLHGAETIAAIWIEPVSGAALGCQPAGPGYLAKVKQLCQDNDILLVYDEVMCGLGRMGTMHAWHHDQAQFDVQMGQNGVVSNEKQENRLQSLAPDIQMIGKCLAAGVMPAAGLLVNRRIANGLGPKFIHSFTYQAHPTGCAAALATQIEVQRLLEAGRIQRLAECLEREVKKQLGHLSNVANIRGRGLFWGIELQHDDGGPWAHDVAAELVSFGEDDYFVQRDACIRFYASAWRLRRHEGPERKGDHIMLSPAFTFTEEGIIDAITKLSDVVRRYFENSVHISHHRATVAKGAFVP
ncbi:pyridoxal phosphate-dependent transferase [Apiospora arundinis]